MLKRAVSWIYMHMHADEALALFKALYFGRSQFLGIDNIGYDYRKMEFAPDCKIKFKSLGRSSKEELIRKQYLALGCGGDIDEHVYNGQQARLENSSAVKIMMERLELGGVKLGGCYAKMANEINFWDNNPGCPKTHIATMLKVCQATWPGEEYIPLSWAMKVFCAVARQLHDNTPKAPDEPEFLPYMTELIQGHRGFSDDKARAKVLEFLKEEDEMSSQVLGLKSIFQALWRQAKELKINPKKELFMAARIMFVDQYNFHGLRSMLENDVERVNKWNVAIGNKRSLRCGIISTDRPVGHSVLQSMNYRLTVVRNPANKTCSIMCDQKWIIENNLQSVMMEGVANLAAMLRYRDLPKAIRGGMVWEKLKTPGEFAEHQVWYLAKAEWYQILNGSFSHEAIPTSLEDEDLKALIKAAFDPDEVKRWRRELRVPTAAEIAKRSGSFGELTFAAAAV